MDLLEKCRRFLTDPAYAERLGYPTNPRTAQAQGLYPYFIPLEESEGTTVVIGGRRLIMIGSNNYLGLTTDPRVQRAAADAVARYGTSCTGSRFLNGTLALHLELEERLAHYVGKEKALVFATGYQANLGAVSALVGRNDIVVCDKEDHASIFDGCRLSLGEMRRFRHNDVADLDRVLSACPRDVGRLVVVDGVFSMSGEIAPLREIADCCRRHGARLMVDDAHGIGVTGGGRGTSAHHGVTESVDLIMGTFSKSLASVGGFIAGDEASIHWIQHRARSLIFSASLPAASAAAALAALGILESEPERVARVNELGERMRRSLRELGFDTAASETPIVPIVVGGGMETLLLWRELFDAGVYTNVALPPAVPEGRCLLRTSYMATHTDEHIAEVIRVFGTIRRSSANP
ncbi:MAG: Serine palmitoyltransferase [Candidatus Bipolaricaulis sibiricus]|uniref:Serine palmitoyltransferase n=1 Tax=Bipolaricaulis sibiricus TaxID=2501609 RepID=A0A410FVQ2_BIPS1|nr:MAG: Serine palmitoyltransferase [Candidatus Bipolaricaulis sibiricus]